MQHAITIHDSTLRHAEHGWSRAVRGLKKYLCLSLLALASLAPSNTLAQTLRIGAAGELRTADPHAFNDSTYNAILRSMYEPLVDFNPRTYRLEGVLAESWRFITPTRLEFNLKKNIFYHNGARLSSADVAFSLMRASHPTSTFQIYTKGITEVRIRGRHTLEIILSNSNPVILNQLTELLIVNKAWMQERQALSAQKITTPTNQALKQTNGTGPFLLKSWGNGSKIVFAKNPKWWGRLPTRSPIEIEYHAIANQSERVQHLLEGRLDLVLDPSIEGLAKISRSPGLTTLRGLDNRVIYIGMDQIRPELLYSNIQGRNPLANQLVRKALYHAIDIEKIQKDIMSNQIEVRGTIVAPHVSGWAQNLDQRLSFDPKVAKLLLAQAGYPDGFESKLLCPKNRYLNDALVCDALAKMWNAVGVRIHVDTKPISQVIPDIHSNTYSLYLLGWASPTFDAHYTLNSLIRSPYSQVQPSINGTGYHNTKADRLIDQIAIEPNVQKRRALMTRVLRMVREDVSVIPLYNQVSHWAHSRNLSIQRRSDMRPDWTSIQIKKD